MKNKKVPRSGTVTIGDRPLWQTWAEEKINAGLSGQKLLDSGGFTINDFMRMAPKGWTRDKCARMLEDSGLKHEIAPDPREYNSRKVRFYFPEKKT